MKRTKPPLQPTRIMPKRGKTRQDVTSSTETGENSRRTLDAEDDNSQKSCPRTSEEASSSSTSPQQSKTLTSTGSPLNSGARRKCAHKTSAENSTSSVSSPPVSASTTDARAGRESPELPCSICLGAVEDRAFTDACYHTFCFECLLEWSRVRAVCPLCKKTFHSIIHSFRSYDNYELYQVPTSYVSNIVNISSLNRSSPSNLSRAGRFWNRTTVNVPSHSEQMLAFRRRVYSHSSEMQLRGLWSSDGVVVPPPPQVSPAMFDYYPVMLERVRPWILRDIAVIIGNGDVQVVAGVVLDLLQHFPVTSEEFYDRLFPFLGPHTRRFLVELDAFARSPFDMTTYDARVVYTASSDATVPLRLSAEHVEDISSGDDSDIEIVSPAMATYSESSRNYVSEVTSDHTMPDLLHYLQAVQQNMLLSFTQRQNFTSGMESPVPGPSGLGQALLTDESESVGSQTTQSINDADVQSNSPMVLSDADSDVMVVDIDRSVHSPINISSGEEDEAVRQIRAWRRAKRRRRKKKKREQSERESTDSMTHNVITVERSEIPQSELCPPSDEPSASDRVSSDRFVEQKAEELVFAMKQGENTEEPTAASIQMQKQPSSRSSSVELNALSSAGNTLQPHRHEDAGKATDSARLFSKTHPKRSRSANSIRSLPAKSDDVKPLTCKKHVSGHKSSKRKTRELVAENSSGDLACENVEKSVSGSQVGATTGSFNLPADERSSSDCQYTTNSVTVASVCEDDVACEDLSAIPQLSEELTTARELPTCSQLNVCDGVSVPCTSDTCDKPVDLTLRSESSLFAVQVHRDATSQPSPLVLDVPHSDGAASLCDVFLPEPSDAAEMLQSTNCPADVDSCGCETRTITSDACVQPDTEDISGNCDSEHSCPGDASSAACLRTSPDLHPNCSSSSPCLTHEFSDSHSQVTSSSSSYNTKLHVSTCDDCESRNEKVSRDVSLPLSLKNSTLDNQLVDSESVSGAADKSDCLHTYAGISESLSLSSPVTEAKDTALHLTGSSSTGRDQSPDGLVINLEMLNSGIDDDDAIAVATDSSDSEVEYLQTDTVGRQRCISISSSDSSDFWCKPDNSDVESVLSDSDSLEVFEFDDEISVTGVHYSESQQSSQTTPTDNGDNSHLLELDDQSCSSEILDIASAAAAECKPDTVVCARPSSANSMDNLQSRDDGDNSCIGANISDESVDDSWVTQHQVNVESSTVGIAVECSRVECPLPAVSPSRDPATQEETVCLKVPGSSGGAVHDELENAEIRNEVNMSGSR